MKSKLHHCDAFAFLASARGPFDLVLLDPPFSHGTLNRVLPELSRVVASGGVVLCESEREAILPETAGELTRVKQYAYGKILVTPLREDAAGMTPGCAGNRRTRYQVLNTLEVQP